MASKIVRTAVSARLVAWTHAPIIEPNQAADPPASRGAFLSVQYPPVGEETVLSIGTAGSNVFREEGVIRFVLSIPKGVGLDPYQDWLEELRALFRGKEFAGVTTWEASPAAFDDDNDRGNYYALTCAVEYRFDLIG